MIGRCRLRDFAKTAVPLAGNIVGKGAGDAVQLTWLPRGNPSKKSTSNNHRLGWNGWRLRVDGEPTGWLRRACSGQ